MNSLKSTKILVTSLICIITIVLCSCNRTSFDSHNYSTTLELVGYESGNSLAIKYPSGEQAALVPLEMATAGFPGIADTRQDNGDVQFHVFYGYNQKGLHWAVICSGPSLGFMNTIAIFKKANNKRKRQTNAGNPAVKQNQVPYEPRQGASPDFGPSIHEGGPSSWTTSSQWDSDRDCRVEGTVLSFPFLPGPPGQPLHGESAYCPSQQCHRA